MVNRFLASFSSPERHARISEIIVRHSDNPVDIREVALKGLDLHPVREILDLGCGFGFLSERVLPRVAAGARVTGVDACEENRDAFLGLAERHHHAAEFRCLTLPAPLPWSSGSFDLVLASFALYFFVEQLPEIARVLRPDGMFLTITHSESSFRNLHEAVGLEECPQPFRALIRNFSAENGAARLEPHFQRIEKLDYFNTLRFEPEQSEDVVEYVHFKWPLLFPETDAPAGLRSMLEGRLGRLLECGPFVLVKNDAVFRCWRPRAADRGEDGRMLEG